MFKNTMLNLSPRNQCIAGEKLTLPEESMGDHVKVKQKRAGQRAKDVGKVVEGRRTEGSDSSFSDSEKHSA